MAAIEFALTAPFVLLLGLATLDTVAYLRASLRLERTAAQITNVTAQAETLTEADITALFSLTESVAGTNAVTGPGGRVVLSGIGTASDGAPVLQWQRAAGRGNFGSRFGATTGTIPAGRVPAVLRDLELPTGQTAVAAELYLQRTPWFFAAGIMPSQTFTSLSAFAIERPRTALLDRILP